MEYPRPNGGRPRGKGISTFIRDLVEEQDPATGQPRNKQIASALISMALDDKLHIATRLKAIVEIMDRLEGRPLNRNENVDVTPSPLADIPTEILEKLRENALKARQEMENKHPGGTDEKK